MKFKFRLLLLSILVLVCSANIKAQGTSIMENYSQVLLDKYIQIAKENYPRSKAFQTRIDIAKNAVAIQNLNWFDIFSVTFIYAPNATYNILDPTYFDGIQLGISLNIANFLQKPRNVKKTKFDLQVARYDQEEYLLNIERQVKTLYTNHLQARQALLTQTNSATLSQSIFEQIKTKYDRGETTFLEFNQAQQSYFSSQSAKYGSEAAMLNAKYNLEELLTRTLESIK